MHAADEHAEDRNGRVYVLIEVLRILFDFVRLLPFDAIVSDHL
jgi:hypothetical protein